MTEQSNSPAQDANASLREAARKAGDEAWKRWTGGRECLDGMQAIADAILAVRTPAEGEVPLRWEQVGWLRDYDVEGEEVTEICAEGDPGAYAIYRGALPSPAASDIPERFKHEVAAIANELGMDHQDLTTGKIAEFARGLRAQVERLKDIIRSCVHGAEIVDIGGENIGLHRPNKHCMKHSSTNRAPDSNHKL